MPDEPQIMLAEDSHWPGIWSVFQEVIAGGDTYMFSPETAEADARQFWLARGGDRRATFVTFMDGVVVAAALIKPNTTGLGDHIANGAWIVSRLARGKGVGRRLAEHAIEHARRLGFHGMQFNAVIASNAGAIALWRSLGFEIVGTIPGAFRHATLGLTPIHVMYRKF